MLNQNNRISLSDKSVLPMQRADSYMQKGDYQSAITEFTTVIQIERNTEAAGLAYLNRGEALARLGHVERAVEDWNQAIAVAPKSPFTILAYKSRARFWEVVGQFGKAVADISSCIQLDSTNATLFNLRANYHRQMQDNEGAIKDYSSAIHLNPQDYVCYLNRAHIYRKVGNSTRAMEDYNRAVTYGQNDGDTYFYRANLLYAMQDFDKALDDINKAIALDNNDPYFYSNRAEIRLSLGEPDGAIEDFYRTIQLQPESMTQLKPRIAMAYNIRAVNQDKMRLNRIPDYTDYDELSIADSSKAIELCPDEAMFYLNRGRKYLEMGLLDIAIADHQSYLRLEGVEKYGQEDEVKDTIRKMESCKKLGTPWMFVNFDPELQLLYSIKANTLVQRGMRLRKEGDLAGALRKFTGAIALAGNIDSYIARGYTFISLRRFLEATDDFRQALNISFPQDEQKTNEYHTDAYYGMALAFYRLGNLVEAKNYIQEARKRKLSDQQFEDLWRDIHIAQ